MKYDQVTVSRLIHGSDNILQNIYTLEIFVSPRFSERYHAMSLYLRFW